MSAPLVVAAEPDHAHSAEHRGSGNEHHDREGAKNPCCTSAACSGPGVMSTWASLFVKPVSIACHAAPLDRRIPFKVTPSEGPPHSIRRAHRPAVREIAMFLEALPCPNLQYLQTLRLA